MGWLRIFGARWRGLLSKRQLDQDLDAELRAHLEMLTEENIRRGMSPVEARYAARREFGVDALGGEVALIDGGEVGIGSPVPR